MQRASKRIKQQQFNEQYAVLVLQLVVWRFNQLEAKLWFGDWNGSCGLGKAIHSLSCVNRALYQFCRQQRFFVQKLQGFLHIRILDCTNRIRDGYEKVYTTTTTTTLFMLRYAVYQDYIKTVEKSWCKQHQLQERVTYWHKRGSHIFGCTESVRCCVDGQLIHEHTRDGQLYGFFEERTAKGELQARGCRHVTGLWQNWYDNGQLAYEAVIPADRTQPYVERSWLLNGTQYEEKTSVDGHLNGPYRKWHSNGVLKVQGMFRTLTFNEPSRFSRAFFVGEYKTWSDTGVLLYHRTYNNNGKVIQTFPC